MATSTPAPAYTFKTVLKLKPFRTLWLAQFVSIFGDFLALFGVIALITFRWHRSAVEVTAVTIAYLLPLAIIGPVAGVFVDHWNVKRIMIASDLIRAGLIVGLAFATDVRQICVIFAILQAFYVVRLFSPALAGMLVAWLTEKSCFYLDTASFIFSAIMISTLSVVRPTRAQTEKTVQSLTQDFLAGNKFIFTHAGLAFVFIAMAMAMFMMGSFSPLISIYIRDSLSAGPKTFGIISAMVGVGLIAGTQLMNRLGKRSKPHVVVGGLLGLGIGVGLLGLFHNLPMAALSTFTMGFGIAFVWVPAQTMSQQETPPAMVGRVSSSFMSLISLAQVLGLLLSGLLAQKLGIRPLFLTSAGMLALIAGVGYLMIQRKTATATAQTTPP